MRAIFITLLLANIVIFGWYQYRGTNEAPPSVTTPLSSGVSLGNLRLAKVSVPAVAVSVATPDPVSIPPVCIQVGAFAAEGDATQAQARLAALDITSKMTLQQKQVIKDYWVYLEPYPTFQDAKNQLAELNLKGVDSFIFTEGDIKNGLSLGVYSKRDNAASIFKKIEELGYTPRILESFQEMNAYYLLLSIEGSSFFNPGILETLQLRYPNLESQNSDC